MIIQETVQIKETSLLHTYSDAGVYIRQEETGAIYDEAYDVIPCRFTYTETSDPIDPDETTEAEYAEIGRILMGETEAGDE